MIVWPITLAAVASLAAISQQLRQQQQQQQQFPPVIDGEALFKYGARDPAALPVIHAIDNALRGHGVFILENHGANESLATTIDDLSRRFWRLPRHVKARLERGGETTRGWTDHELTKQRLDLKELYGYGAQSGRFHSTVSDGGVDGANRFFSDAEEEELGLAGMHAALEQHFQESQRIGRRLVEAFAVVLNRTDAEVDALVRGHNSFAVLNYFAPGRAREGGNNGLLGVHPHTDAGLVTLLRLDDVSGLDVLVRAARPDGSFAAGDDHFGSARAGDRWAEVPVSKVAIKGRSAVGGGGGGGGGRIVVNLGDMAQVWSNDRWHAAVHRVRSPGKARARYSHAHFMNPNEGSEFGGGRSPRYRAFRWADFRAARAKGDASNLGSEVQISQYRVK